MCCLATFVLAQSRQFTHCSNKDENQAWESRQDMLQFTATGRPYRPPQPTKEGWSMNSMSGTETFGAGPANLLPMIFTDDSLITIPILRPEDKGKARTSKRKRSLFAFGRKAKGEFIMRQVTRGEHPKHYAKDDSGMYVGKLNACLAPRKYD